MLYKDAEYIIIYSHIPLFLIPYLISKGYCSKQHTILKSNVG